MAVPTATFGGLTTGSESRRSPRASELWVITGGSGGSSDGDQVAITTRMKKPQRVVGGVSRSISGQVVTVTLITALAEGEILDIDITGYIA